MCNHVQRQIRQQAEYATTGLYAVLLGEWGSGKTHFMNCLKSYLCGKDYEVSYEAKGYTGTFRICNVDLWHMRTKEEMWNHMIYVINTAITGRSFFNQKIWFNIIGAIPDNISSPYLKFAKNLSKIIQCLSVESDERSAFQISRYMQSKCGNDKILLMIDDVERADRECINNLFPVLDRLKKIPGIVVVLAMAENDFLNLNGPEQVKFAQGLIVKLFDLTIRLPQLNPAQCRDMLRNKLAERQNKYSSFKKHPVSRLENFIMTNFYDENAFPYIQCSTPRQVERIFTALERWNDDYMDLAFSEFSADINKNAPYIFFVEIIRKSYNKLFENIRAIRSQWAAEDAYASQNVNNMLDKWQKDAGDDLLLLSIVNNLSEIRRRVSSIPFVEIVDLCYIIANYGIEDISKSTSPVTAKKEEPKKLPALPQK